MTGFAGILLAGLAVLPGHAVFVEQQDYLPVPEAAQPLEGLLPTRGVEGTGGRGLLKVNTAYLKRSHNVNFETREVEVVEYLAVPTGAPSGAPAQDSSALWQAYYSELSVYSEDMGELAWRRKWLNGLIGQEEASQAGAEGMLDIVLPVNVPDWMKRIGVDKPRLQINGSYKLVVEGSRLSGNGAPGGGDSWFPNLHMDQQPAFSVKGSIGRLINIEINSEESFGTNLKEQLKITYKGEGDELEDDIIQEIEAGNTSLALTGTSLTGYTETHKGLFGLKMRMRFGGLEVTTIASQEGGSQEKQTLGLGTSFSEFVIEDRAIDLHRHFYLMIPDRRDYGNPENWKGASPKYLNDPAARGRRIVEVFQLLLNNEETGQYPDTSTACAYTAEGTPTELCESGRWKPLRDGVDFHYDERLRMLTVPGGHRNQSLAVRWQGDWIPRTNGPADSRNRILIHSRTAVGVPELDSLMWRNVYNIGKVTKADRDQFRMRIVDKDSLEKALNDSLTYLQRLGLERADRPGQIDFDNPDIFNFDQGYMVLPCRGGVSDVDDAMNCLTPIKRISPSTDIYTRSVDEVLSGSTFARFLVTGKQRKSSFDVRETSHSVSGSQCLDITPGTEKVVRNGSEVLQKNVDYEVLYETGQITLTSPRARDPNAEISVSYECNPPFQIQDKILLGTRLEYKLDGISEESILGATLLYKSQTTTSERPELGREPFNQFLWGFNARLVGAPKWMTRAANLFPFVETEAPSKAAFDFEIAQSRYNPNTKSSAYLDNFEGSAEILSMPTQIYNWFKASPPLFDSTGKPDETLDYRHQGKFWWHSNLQELYSRIYGNTGSSVTNAREQTLLKLTLEPNDNLEGRSWGGVMRALSPGFYNQSRKRVLEVVVQGRAGRLNIDLGQISEDISIPAIKDGEPDGSLQSEIQVGREIVNEKDLGLDGKPDDQETGVRWECRPTCYAIPIDSLDGDRGMDNWKEPDGDDTEEDPRVNGTQRNNQETQGFGFDTEDLDRSGVLDTRNLYLRYSISLDDACTPANHCEPLPNNWRKYQIPLYGGGVRVGTTAGESETQILSSVKMVRLWLGSLPPRVAKSQVLLARLNLVGNYWEEGERNRDFELDSDRFSSGDLRDSAAIRVPPSTPDSNRLRVDVINKQEEKGYRESPRTKIERDTRTDEPLPERSLVLRYENLHPGEAVHATRLLGSDPKDLTQYDRILLEVHPDSSSSRHPEYYKPGQNRVSLGLRLGKDLGNRESRDYYEIKLHMDTSDKAVFDPKHRALWDRNSFEVDMDGLTSLKNDPLYQSFLGRRVSRKAFHKGRGDSSLTLSVVGNPTLSRIDWMRMVIYVDSNAVELQQGEIWLNDLRLEGVDKTLGTSMNTRLQLDFSDFVSVSGNLTYANGGFTTMSQARATPANSRSTVDYNAAASLYANKFFPDQWGLSIPINLQYQGSIARPFTRPSSDFSLTGTGFADMMSDILRGNLRSADSADSASDRDSRYARLYQSTTFNEKFSIAYKKEHRSQSFLTQAFFERPDLQYSFASTDQDDFFTTKEGRNYDTKVIYSLSPFENKSFRPMEKTAKWKYMPKFLSDIEVTPWWDKLNLTLWDMTFARARTLNKPRNELDVPINNPAEYTVELAHSTDLEWRPLNFFNFGYRVEASRDFDNEHECFDETFFGQGGPHGCDQGILARNLVFSWDDPDLQAGHLGDQYLILARERNRSQTFHASLNPNIFSWLTLGANYNAGFRQTRLDSLVDRSTGSITRPEHFEAGADHDVRFNASLSLPALLGEGKGFLGTVKKAMDKWSLRNLDGSYTVSHKYNGEQFTYGHLGRNVSPGSYYAYQFGMVYDGLGGFADKLFEGEPNPEFLDWLSSPDDALNEIKMSHEVSRTVDASTGLTVPVLDLSLSFNAKYNQTYNLFRAIQASDTSVVWPDYTVTGTFNDFASRIGILRRYFRSMTSTTTFNYREEDKRALFSNSAESHKTTIKFDPLVRIAATTNKDVRGEMSLKLGRDVEDQFFKTPGQPVDVPYYDGTTPMVPYTRIDSLKNPKESFNVGGEASLSKDIETQKGVQFWRYYIKLKNNLRLKLSSSCNYQFTESRFHAAPPVRSQDVLTGTVKPEASYNFTNNVDALFFLMYKYDKLWHTARNESTHELQIHGEFTMRF